jgi:hypothetical protein
MKDEQDDKIYTHCPICGHLLTDEGISGSELRGSFWICECCGCEFGYDDTPAYREKWIEGGCAWFNPKARPQEWSLDDQLKRADLAWLKPSSTSA